MHRLTKQNRQLSFSRAPDSPDHFPVGMTTRQDHTYPPSYKTSSYKVGLILMVHRLFKAVINNIAVLRKERIATLSAIFHKRACEISEQFLQTLHHINQPKLTEGHQVSDICFSCAI